MRCIDREQRMPGSARRKSMRVELAARFHSLRAIASRIASEMEGAASEAATIAMPAWRARERFGLFLCLH